MIGQNEMMAAMERATEIVNLYPSWAEAALALDVEPDTFAMLRDYAAMVSSWEGMTPEKVFGMGVLVGVIAGTRAGLLMERR